MKEYSADKSGAPQKDAERPGSEHATDERRPGELNPAGGEGRLAGAAWRFGRQGEASEVADRTEEGPVPRSRSRDSAMRHLNAKLVSKLLRSTGIDLSAVLLSTDPSLTEQGKAGAAVEGREIKVAPGNEENEEVLAHEAGHIIQQMPVGARAAREASPKEGAGSVEGQETAPVTGEPGGSGPSGESKGLEQDVDLEAEADGVAAAVLAGEAVEVRGVGSGVLYEESSGDLDNSDFVFDDEPAFVSTPEKGLRGGWHVVEPRESLSKVADEWYGEQGKYTLIYHANREVIGDNPSAIGKGMRLFVPPLDVKTALQTHIVESMTMANETSRDTNYPNAPVDSPNPSHELIEINGEFPNGYMDPNYWEYAGQRWSFKLVDGASASAAVDSLFKGPTRLECESMLVAVLARSVKETVGPVVFDREFGAVGKSNQDLVIGTSSSQDLVTSRLYKMLEWPHPEHRSELLPGDMVWIATFDPDDDEKKDQYQRKHPGGYWQGLNAIYIGEDVFQGFGDASQKYERILEKLLENYDEAPTDAQQSHPQFDPSLRAHELKDVNQVFGIVLKATTRISDVKLSEMLK